MKQLLTIALLGIGVACLAYCGVYYLGTAKYLAHKSHDKPELHWLKTEFGLSDAEYERISRLHNAFLPKCDEMCALVAEKNALLKRIMHSGDADTEDRNRAIEEVVQIRADCQAMMLKHFYRVSQEMQPDARRKYMEWVLSRTLPPSHAELEELLQITHERD